MTGHTLSPLHALPRSPHHRRVLIFLEALALGRELPTFGLHLCTQLLAAAQHLGLRALEVRWLWQGRRWAGVAGWQVTHRPVSQHLPGTASLI